MISQLQYCRISPHASLSPTLIYYIGNTINDADVKRKRFCLLCLSQIEVCCRSAPFPPSNRAHWQNVPSLYNPPPPPASRACTITVTYEEPSREAPLHGGSPETIITSAKA